MYKLRAHVSCSSRYLHAKKGENSLLFSPLNPPLAHQEIRSLLFKRDGAVTHLYPSLHDFCPKSALGALSGKHIVPGPSHVILQHFKPFASQLVSSMRRSWLGLHWGTWQDERAPPSSHSQFEQPIYRNNSFSFRLKLFTFTSFFFFMNVALRMDSLEALISV